MPSIEHEEIVAMMAEGLGLEELSVEDQRAIMEASAGMFPVGTDVQIGEVDAAGVTADWVTTSSSAANRVVLYLHGGGYSMGSRNTHRSLASRIARATGARVLLPEYRLAPEDPFPAAVEDATTCWNWLVSEGFTPERMAIAGDSAGGGLALATVLAVKATGASLPACAIGLSPWTDLEGSGPSTEPGAANDPMLTPEGVRESGRLYAGAHVRDPLAAPIHGDLTGFPPVLLQVGTREILLSDTTRFAEKARAAGVDVTLEIEEGLIHVWHMFPDVPEARDAIDRVGAFVREHLA